MFDFIAEILAFVIKPIYHVVQNYGWTIIIFTVLIKLLTLPFTIKSQKSMAKMQQVQPLISEVQKKYANNKEKQQQELMKIYEKYQKKFAEISPYQKSSNLKKMGYLIRFCITGELKMFCISRLDILYYIGTLLKRNA